MPECPVCGNHRYGLCFLSFLASKCAADICDGVSDAAVCAAGPTSGKNVLWSQRVLETPLHRNFHSNRSSSFSRLILAVTSGKRREENWLQLHLVFSAIHVGPTSERPFPPNQRIRCKEYSCKLVKILIRGRLRAMRVGHPSHDDCS